MDIRKELNKLSVPQLKAIARKHNAHYIIRLGVRKVELVEKLASLYESMRDEYMSSRGYEINVKNPKMNVIRKRAEPVPVRAVEAPKQRPKPAVDLIAKIEVGLDEREKEIEKIKTGMQEILKKKELTGIKEKARGVLSALVAKQKEEKEAEAKKKEAKAKEDKKTYSQLTKEEKKQATMLIKKRDFRRKENVEKQRAMAKDLAIVNQTKDEGDNENKRIEELAKILGKTPKELAKEMDVDYSPTKEAKAREAVKFSYNKKFVFNPSQEQLKLMAGNQDKFDFYQTPDDVLQQIYNDLFAYSGRYFDFNGTNALEPSAGNGALLSLLIDNQDSLKLANLDAIEFDGNMAKLLKENFKISHIYNDNFFTFKQERPYDLILMNPPYEGLVGTNADNRFNSKVAYLYHIARAILLKSSNGTMKTIYAVVPQLKGVSWPREFPNNKQYEFEDVVMRADEKRMEQIFGMPFDDFPRALITRIGTSDKFEKIVYSRGKFNKRPLGMTVDIYRILVF